MMCRQTSRKMEDNFSAALLSAGICGHTGFLTPLSHPQGLVMNPRCFLMTMMMTEQKCLPSSPIHVHTHTYTHTPLPLPLGCPSPKGAFPPLLSAHQANLQWPPVSGLAPSTHAGTSLAAPRPLSPQEARAQGLGQGTRGTG